MGRPDSSEVQNRAQYSLKRHRWGVILAGGDGTRLQPLTRLACGDNRPKQFCPLLGGKTLLAQTRKRVAKTIDPDRVLFVLTKKHERFYKESLECVPGFQNESRLFLWAQAIDPSPYHRFPGLHGRQSQIP